MKILVTGASGFIGSRTVAHFVSSGHNVIGVDLKPSSQANRHYSVDVTEAERVQNIFSEERPEAVLHLAAQISVASSVQSPVHDANQNIMGSLSVFEAARKFGVKKVVFASTAAVYGDSPIPPISEDTPLAPVSPYGISKVSAETYLREFYSQFYSYGIIRYGNVFGPHQDPQTGAVLARFIHDIKASGKVTIFGDGHQKRDFIFIDDVARANEAALLTAENFTINLGSSVATEVIVLLEYMQDILGRSIPVEYKPTRAGDIYESYYNVSKANEVLNWEAQVSLDDGLRRILQEHFSELK